MKIQLTAIAALLGASALAAGAQAADLISNGGFETGTFAGWTETDQAGGSGSWFVIANGGNTPLNSATTPSLGTGGNFIAVTDQRGPGSHTLSQSFLATAGSTYILTFDSFGDDQSGAGPIGVGTDYNTPRNQHYEVNLIGTGTNLIYTGNLTPGWASYSFDLSSLITSSGTYSVAFTEVDNQLFSHQGLDNVALNETGGVPEPASWAMMLVGFAGIGGMVRSRRRVAVTG